MITTTKRCSTCKETKGTYCFGKASSARDGLKGQCKSCRKAFYEANSTRLKANMKADRLKHIDRRRASEQKYNSDNRDGRRAYARSHNAALKLTRTQAESSAIASTKAASRRSGLLAADLYGGLTFTEACAMTLPFAELRIKLEQETGVAHHIDHIVPIANGGTHTADNLQVLTASDNITKGNTP